MTYKNGTNKFTLSQKIVLLITFVIVASLLPASLLIAHRVSGVVDERISVNAVSITTLLSHSPAVIRSLTYETVKYSPRLKSHDPSPSALSDSAGPVIEGL